MRASCYYFAFALTPFHALEALVTKLRVLVISVMSAGMGGVAAAGCRLLDSRSSVAAIVGGGAVLSVALVLDAVRFARNASALIADMQAVRKDVESLHVRLDGIETRMPRSSSATRTGSFPL